ncbi:MAG: hydrogenase maturation protease [Thermoleophilaceae bacterium]|jgi:hydrogenase maturation protease|nr:hydrogenase maturation protease [Thermoleophilaceae bacterium]
MDGFEGISAAVPRTVTAAGVEIGRGSRVVLRPREGGDMFGTAMAGMVATVETIHADLDGKIHLAVTLEDDPGRELGEARRPGHRFFFAPDEVEPLAGAPPPAKRVLVAGIGNVFFADDGFGVAVARELQQRELPRGVDVVDFGIRGMDLVFALGEGYDVALFVDAVPRGDAPGTLFLIEPELSDSDEPIMLDAHGMDPVKVLSLAGQLGPVPDRILVVGCEPLTGVSSDDEELVGELSEPVLAAVVPAAEMVEQTLRELFEQDGVEREGGAR